LSIALIVCSIPLDSILAQGFRRGRETEQDSAPKIRNAGQEIEGSSWTPLAILSRRNPIRRDSRPNGRNGVVAEFVREVPAFLDPVDRVYGQSTTPGSKKGQAFDASRATNFAADPLDGDQNQGPETGNHRDDGRRTGPRDEGVLGRRVGLLEITGAVPTNITGALVPDPNGLPRVFEGKEIARIEVQPLHSQRKDASSDDHQPEYIRDCIATTNHDGTGKSIFLYRSERWRDDVEKLKRNEGS